VVRNVSITPDSTDVPPAGCHIARLSFYVPQPRAQPSLSTISYSTLIAAEDTVLWIESLETADDIGVRTQKMLVRRNRKCQLVVGDVSFDKLCFGREANIEAVIGGFNYRLACKLHQSRSIYPYPIYTGRPIEEIVAAVSYRQAQLRSGGKT
jgi:hypothetical protein